MTTEQNQAPESVRQTLVWFMCPLWWNLLCCWSAKNINNLSVSDKINNFSSGLFLMSQSNKSNVFNSQFKDRKILVGNKKTRLITLTFSVLFITKSINNVNECTHTPQTSVWCFFLLHLSLLPFIVNEKIHQSKCWRFAAERWENVELNYCPEKFKH